MRLWYLDNEYLCFVVMASSREDAWRGLAKHHILPFGSAESDDEREHVAYRDLLEIEDGFRVDSPEDTVFIITRATPDPERGTGEAWWYGMEDEA